MRKFAFTAAIIFATNLAFSQGTAINSTGNKADNSAMLDVSSNTKGMLIPRMTTTERNGILSPAEGLLIFNKTSQCYEGYSAATNQWVSFGCIGCQLPGTFTANAASNLTQTSFSANWTTSAGATTYYLDVATDAAFSAFVSGYNNLNVGNVFTASVTGLSCNTTYYYRVRANNSCGTSANSNTISASTNACWACGNNLTDTRDSKSYNTILIGTQCWMKQNLDYGSYVTIATGQSGAGTQKYCIADNQANCTAYGGMYEWEEMMNGSASCNGTGESQPACTTPVQGICPDGWHLGSHYEWTLLERNVGSNPTAFPYDITTTSWTGLGTNEGNNLKEAGTTHWYSGNGGTNSSGFTALPEGYALGGFDQVSFIGYWWTSTEGNSTKAWRRILQYNYATVGRDYENKMYGFSVRCLKN